MDRNLKEIETKVYDKLNLKISNFKLESESKEYAACQFVLNNRTFISRNAKITPTKVGQFVTFWKRNGSGPIEPFNESDSFDNFIVTVKAQNQLGQFVFPKSVLILKGIISSKNKEGKRGFRVYPKWDIAKSKQAIQTQKWQFEFFFEAEDSKNLPLVKSLFS